MTERPRQGNISFPLPFFFPALVGYLTSLLISCVRVSKVRPSDSILFTEIYLNVFFPFYQKSVNIFRRMYVFVLFHIYFTLPL